MLSSDNDSPLSTIAGHILGTYQLINPTQTTTSDGGSIYPVYEKEDSTQHVLSSPADGARPPWVLGREVGSRLGYAFMGGDVTCPEDLTELIFYNFVDDSFVTADPDTWSIKCEAGIYYILYTIER